MKIVEQNMMELMEVIDFALYHVLEGLVQKLTEKKEIKKPL